MIILLAACNGLTGSVSVIESGSGFLQSPLYIVDKVGKMPERAKKVKSKAFKKPVIEAYIRYVE